MRILVSGASGFVGRALCDSLAAGGNELHVLSRSPERAKSELPGVRAAFPFQLEEPVEAAAFEGVDAIVHLAGEPVNGRWTEQKRQAIVTSRVHGTRMLVQGIGRSEHKPKVLVSSSAIGYYGDRGEEELTEDAGPGDDFLAATCIAWEQEALAAESHGLRVACLRTSIVLEKGGGALGQMLLPAKLGLNGPLGQGGQWWSWIHRDDLVALIRFVIEDERAHGAINAAAPCPVRQREFARRLGEVLNRPSFLPAPAFALKTLLGDFSVELLNSRRVIPRKAEQLGFTFRYASLGPALEAALQGN